MLISRYTLFETRLDPMPPAAGVTDGIVNPTGTEYSNKMIPAGDAIGFTLQTTGTLTGTFTLWYSDKNHPSEADDADWVQDATITMTQPAGSATKVKYSVDDMETGWYRVKYVHSSGTGTLFGYAVRQNGD